MRWLPITLLVVATVVVGGAAAMWLLGVWTAADPALSLAEAEQLNLDRIKTGLTVAAGLGAGVTLLVALRKQTITERAQRFTEEHAQEERITNLYVAAVGQLGSDKAAVRLGGLYALERLGQDHDKLRQTVVDVICAYLRMPYAPPLAILQRNSQASPVHGEIDEEGKALQSGRQEELQVRLTAQRLLATHTRISKPPEPSTFWRTADRELMNLDFTSAVLVDLDLSECHLDSVRLDQANVHGSLMLEWAQFHGYVSFYGTEFHAPAFLGRTQFHADINMEDAAFYGYLVMSDAQVHGYMGAQDAQFHDGASLNGTQFHGSTHLADVTFHEAVDLSGTQFYKKVNLSVIQFRKGFEFVGVSVAHGTDLPEGWQLGVYESSAGLFNVVQSNAAQ